MPRPRRLWIVLAIAGSLALGVACVLLLQLDRAVSDAASAERERAAHARPLGFRPASRAGADPGPLGTGRSVLVWGDGRISAAAAVAGALWTAGGSGLSDGVTVLGVAEGLPSLRASAVTSWRGELVFGLERGGWGRLGESGLELATSGFDPLEVRALAETEGGELLLGTRQGLFRAAAGGSELERLADAPVRALALLPGGEVAAGGERGLFAVSRAGGPVRRIEVPDPWIEAAGFSGGALWVATARGVATGPPGAASLPAHPNGSDVTSGALTTGGFLGLPASGGPRVVWLDARGGRREESTPEPFRTVLSVEGVPLADGPSGLFRRDPERGWRLVRARPAGSLPFPHVNALSVSGADLWVGFFEGGVARASWTDAVPRWVLTPPEGPWGVNALLAGGDAVYVASLRGAYRLDRSMRPLPLEGAGGAFSLAAMRGGIAIGYAGGVLLPDRRLLSAFHGLPGNQAYALAATPLGEALWVGTPTGLGRLERHRVTARAIPGEGRLPHPWVTGLLPVGDTLVVGTYGGGLARRTGEGPAERWERFPETRGVKVNAGALVCDPLGRVLVGTVGKGLLRSDPAITRFDPLPLPIPSPDVYSLALAGDSLLVGTDQGLALVRPESETETR